MRKIKTLIFDFGDVFINLDKPGAMQNALNFATQNARTQPFVLRGSAHCSAPSVCDAHPCRRHICNMPQSSPTSGS